MQKTPLVSKFVMKVKLTPQRNRIFLSDPLTFPPSALTKSWMYWGWLSYVAAVIKLPSIAHAAKLSGSIQEAPAAARTGPTGGYAVHFRPLTNPAAAKINCPWQTVAIGFPDSENFLTKLCTELFIARYSGARPPGITNPSYLSKSISSNVAFSAKLCPRDSE